MSILKNADQVLGSAYREETESIAVDTNSIEETLPSIGDIKITSSLLAEQITIITTECKQIWIKALSSNTHDVYIGTDNEINSNLPGLSANESIIVNIKNPSSLYLLTEIIGEGIKWRAII